MAKSKLGSKQASETAGVALAADPVIVLTEEQIAERAFAIWQSRGCFPGEDVPNWMEAEAQLEQERRAG